MMNATALSGGLTEPAIDAARIFRAAMTAMARPGEIRQIADVAPPAPLSPAAGALLLTLCDTETPVHLAGAWDDGAARDWLTFHTGAPLVARGSAMFAVGDWADLAPITDFPVGEAEFPDRSASLIVEVWDLSQDGARLSGPGIKETARLSLPEIGVFQANRALYPLGLDFWFTCGDRLAALPRTTIVEDA